MDTDVITRSLSLDKLPLKKPAQILSIDWTMLRDKDAKRLRELGVDTDVTIEKLHRGPFGLDPIACRIGRMTVALRSAQAAAIRVEPTEQP